MEENRFKNTVLLKKLHDDAVMLSVGSQDAACFDLSSIEDVEFGPGEVKLVRTGWAIEPPHGFRLNLYVRSSTPLKKGFMLANSVGIVDQDYRGELLIQLYNIRQSPNKINKGDKIAQAEFVHSIPVADNFKFVGVTELSETKRGSGGFGSSGN